MLLGIKEFEEAMGYFHEREYEKSEKMLKEALGIIKNANQSHSLGYIFILKRLAYVCFMSRKFIESEKYFTVASNLMPQVSKNPVNIYNA